MTYTIPGYDAWKLATPDHYDYEPEQEYCEHCDELREPEQHCTNEQCTCQACGETLPESDSKETPHCQNCCECDECAHQWWLLYFDALETGAWRDIPVITGEKVYTLRDRQEQR